MKNQTYFVPLLVSVLIVAGCGKSEEKAAEGSRFDAKAIAAEADRGNLGPLTELNAACSSEVQRNGKRMTVCKVQDDVRDLRKPFNIRF